ncbi:MAG: hypothetical protein GY804_08875 [Alphaproteobacteria bacterium]|nr:hypothetical protein [Alphaproteobacteria bacterium]
MILLSAYGPTLYLACLPFLEKTTFAIFKKIMGHFTGSILKYKHHAMVIALLGDFASIFGTLIVMYNPKYILIGSLCNMCLLIPYSGICCLGIKTRRMYFGGKRLGDIWTKVEGTLSIYTTICTFIATGICIVVFHYTETKVEAALILFGFNAGLCVFDIYATISEYKACTELINGVKPLR